MKINPEYEKLVPALSETDYNNLYESIKKDGLWHPILVNDKQTVLDGHNRFRICDELNITPRFDTKIFDSQNEEEIFVLESSLNRRNLTTNQKTAISYELLPRYKIEGKKKKSEGGGDKKSDDYKENRSASKDANRSDNSEDSNKKKSDNKSTTKAAKKTGISPKTLERYKYVLKFGDEKTINDMKSDKIKVTKAYSITKTRIDKGERKKEIAKTQVILPDTITLHNQEFQTLKIPDNSVSLIFTDPPYHDEFLPLFKDLAMQAARVLKEGGSLMTFVGQTNIPEICDYMRAAGLDFHWPICVLHTGRASTMHSTKTMVEWKPMLWFTKGKYQGEYVRDLVKSKPPNKDEHEWAQSTEESDYYIKHLTIENEIVYDPFMGSGTFGVSAKKLKRQFIGCEVDKDYYNSARRIIFNAL